MVPQKIREDHKRVLNIRFLRLSTYVKKSYGLTISDCCKFAYDLPKVNNFKITQNWDDSRNASIDMNKEVWQGQQFLTK